jgi:hypothetical protein
MTSTTRKTPVDLEELTSLAATWRSVLASRRDLPLDSIERGPGFDSFNSAMAVCLKQLDETITRLREDAEI